MADRLIFRASILVFIECFVSPKIRCACALPLISLIRESSLLTVPFLIYRDRYGGSSERSPSMRTFSLNISFFRPSPSLRFPLCPREFPALASRFSPSNIPFETRAYPLASFKSKSACRMYIFPSCIRPLMVKFSSLPNAEIDLAFDENSVNGEYPPLMISKIF